MKIKVIEPTRASGKALEKDKEYTVSDKDGRFLVGIGKALEVKPKPKKADV